MTPVNVATGQPGPSLHTSGWLNHQDPPSAAAISPDGQTLYVAVRSGLETFRVSLSTRTGRHSVVRNGTANAVAAELARTRSLAISGRLLLSRSAVGSAVVWLLLDVSGFHPVLTRGWNRGGVEADEHGRWPASSPAKQVHQCNRPVTQTPQDGQNANQQRQGEAADPQRRQYPQPRPRDYPGQLKRDERDKSRSRQRTHPVSNAPRSLDPNPGHPCQRSDAARICGRPDCRCAGSSTRCSTRGARGAGGCVTAARHLRRSGGDDRQASARRARRAIARQAV